jgi:hypothetical protein
MVSGDAERLQQIVWNLLSNAIKFTPRGGRIDVRLEQTEEHVRLTVADDGIGIDPAMLSRLFDRFWQADSSMTRAHGGLGLGLAVVRHLVEMHGGTVHAESAGTDRGATFTVTLPALVARGSHGNPHPQPTSPRRLTDAAEGAQGPGRRRRSRHLRDDRRRPGVRGRRHPHVLLGEPGVERDRRVGAGPARLRHRDARRRRLHAHPKDPHATTEEGGRMLAVALTAYGRSEDRTKALSAGFQVHVGKPVEPNQLVSVVASSAGLRTGYPATSPCPTRTRAAASPRR